MKKESPSGTAIYVGDHYELQQAVIGEVGQVQVKHWPIAVQLEGTYENPVVFAQPPSYAGKQPAVVRITEAQADSFTLHVDEAPIHTTCHILVFQACNALIVPSPQQF